MASNLLRVFYEVPYQMLQPNPSEWYLMGLLHNTFVRLPKYFNRIVHKTIDPSFHESVLINYCFFCLIIHPLSFSKFNLWRCWTNLSLCIWTSDVNQDTTLRRPRLWPRPWPTRPKTLASRPNSRPSLLGGRGLKNQNICNNSLLKTRRHVKNIVKNVRNWVNYKTKSQKLNNSKCK